MENINLGGRIIATNYGVEASVIIPVGDYRIMILTDDSCGAGKGEVKRARLFVYHKDKRPSEGVNEKVFGEEDVIADSETIWDAMLFCQRKLKARV